MLITIDWTTFMKRYLLGNNVFVKETDIDWTCYTTVDHFIVQCIIPKSLNPEDNIAFVNRYFVDHQNVVKIKDIRDEGDVMPPNKEEIESEMEDESAIREEDMDDED